MRKRETGKTSSNLYKSYRNLYNRLVRIAKTMHYTSLIDRYKGDIAHTWQVLNDITGKRNKSELCDTFNINSIPTNDANTISNAFCNYFTNIGQQCASTIGQATTRSSNYLEGNYQNSLFMIPTTPGDIIAIISSFKSKTSSGHDGVSSKLVKDLKYALSFPLSIIINNSLAMGLVPNMAKPYLTYGIILWGPTYRCHLKQVSILQKKAIRCINKLYYNAHTEPLFIRNKILKLDDLYKFELSKFMFDCINGKLPTPILEFFITNATIHAHHTRQRNVPHVTQTFGTISERAVTYKGPKTWTEIPQTIRLHQNKNIFSRLLKYDYITKYN